MEQGLVAVADMAGRQDHIVVCSG